MKAHELAELLLNGPDLPVVLSVRCAEDAPRLSAGRLSAKDAILAQSSEDSKLNVFVEKDTVRLAT